MSKNTKKQERKNFTSTPNKFLFENRLSVESDKLKMNPAMKLMYIVVEGYIKRAGIEEVQIPLKDMAEFICVSDTKTVRTTKEKLEALGVMKTRVEKIPGTKGNEKTYWSIVKHFTFEMQETEIEEKVNESKVEEKIQVENTGVDVTGKIPLDLEENFPEGVEENFPHPGGKNGQKRKDSFKTLKPKTLKELASEFPKVEEFLKKYLPQDIAQKDAALVANTFYNFATKYSLERCEELMQFLAENWNSIDNLKGYLNFMSKQADDINDLKPKRANGQNQASNETTSTGNKLWTPKRIVREEMVPEWLKNKDKPKEKAPVSREVLLQGAKLKLSLQPHNLTEQEKELLKQEGLWKEPATA